MIGESESRATLVKPPAIDPEKSAIENVLELTELAAIGPVSPLSLLFFLLRSLVLSSSPCLPPSLSLGIHLVETKLTFPIIGYFFEYKTFMAPTRS